MLAAPSGDVVAVQAEGGIERRRADRLVRPTLALIVLAYATLALGYGLATPKWNTPDEPAHFNYVAELATTGRLPVIQAGDWDAELLERLKAARFPPSEPIDRIRYEGHQPPLYYLAAAGLYRLTMGLPLDSQVHVLRGLSIVLGALLLVVAYQTARLVFPSAPLLQVAVPGVVAFVPMHTAMAATVNNDLLAELLGSLALLALLAGVKRGFGYREAATLGLLAGLLVLTKLTVYGYVALAFGTVAWDGLRRGAWQEPSERVALARRLALMAGLTLALAGPWLARNVATYGLFDPLAQRRHEAIVVGQPSWGTFEPGMVVTFLTVLFHSFWGQFGWMGIPLERRLYLPFELLTGAALVGLAWPALATIAARRGAGRAVDRTEGEPDRAALALLAACTVLVFAQLVYYNFSFIQAQGRYLFPAIVPLAAFLAVGWRQLARLQVGAGRLRVSPGVALAGFAALVALGESLRLLLGVDLPGRLLYPGAALAGAGLAIALPERWREPTLIGLIVLGLAGLDLAALVRVVAPYFATS